jgi:sodium-coupled neutral amino acid transporter 11
MLEVTGGTVIYNFLHFSSRSFKYISVGVSATALAYIFPALCFIKLSKGTPWSSKKKIGAVICSSFGVVVLLLSVYLTLKKAWSSESGAIKVCS